MSKTLHSLIRALSKTEKAYFKKYAYKSAAAKSDVHYKIFDVISKQEIYNEQAVLKKVKKFISAKELIIAKNYLYNLLLNCLCDYHQKKSPKAQVYNFLEQIEILVRKNLYNQAEKILQKAKNIAQKHDLHPHLMEVAYWEEKLCMNRLNKEKYKAYLLQGYTQEFVLIDEWKQIRILKKALNDILYIYNKQRFYSINIDAKMKLLYQFDDLDVTYHELSVEAKIIYQSIFQLIGYLCKNIPLALWAQRENIALIEEQPIFLEMNYKLYIHTIANAILSEFNLNNVDKVLHYINKLEKIEPVFFEEEIQTKKTIISVWLTYYWMKGEALNVEHIMTLKDHYNGIKMYLNARIKDELIFLFALIYFRNEDYKNTLEWIEQYKGCQGIELEVSAKVVELIANFELKNYFFIDYTGDSTYRFLHKQKNEYPIEKALIRCLKKVSKLPAKTFKETYFEELEKVIGEVMTVENKVAAYRFIRVWLDFKLKNNSNKLE